MPVETPSVHIEHNRNGKLTSLGMGGASSYARGLAFVVLALVSQAANLFDFFDESLQVLDLLRQLLAIAFRPQPVQQQHPLLLLRTHQADV